MNRVLLNKIKLLKPKLKGLVLGTLSQELERLFSDCLFLQEYFEFNKTTAELFNPSFFEQFDVIFITLNKDDLELFIEYKIPIVNHAICIVDKSAYENFKPFVNECQYLLIHPMSETFVLRDILSILVLEEIEPLLRSKEKLIHKLQLKPVNSDINAFLDQYSGQMMFINDELNEQIKALKNLKISKELFLKVSSQLVQLSLILKEKEELLELSDTFLKFSQFLDTLELEKVQPSCYEVFDYFTLIIEDITFYIDELFVYQLFKDVTIFSDSLSNNIEYFKKRLLGEDHKIQENDVEFF